MRTCNGNQCLRPELEAMKSHRGIGGKGRYELGYRYCAKCVVYFYPKHLRKNLYCKCCKVQTRVHPQHPVKKQKELEA